MRHRTSELLYQHNKELQEIKYSKEYLIGKRIFRNVDLLKKLHFYTFFVLLVKDVKTYFRRDKHLVSGYSILDFDKKYKGGKIAIYTSIYGKYDKLNEPLYIDENCDYYIFTDQDVPKDSIWKKIELKEIESLDSCFLKNRYAKIKGYSYFVNYENSIYIDGNLVIVSEISLLLENFKSTLGIGMHKHPTNVDLYEELKANRITGRISKSEENLYYSMYRKINYPKNFGLFECNVIIRANNNEKCDLIMNKWWNYILDGFKRDQLCFTLALYELNGKCDDVYVIGENINTNPMFYRREHL